MLGCMASFLVTDEALSVPDVLCSFTRREVDLVYVHGVRVGVRSLASQRDITVSSSSEFPELYHIAVELSCLVQPLFPLPTGLSIWEGGNGHHDSELLGYSSLESCYSSFSSSFCLTVLPYSMSTYLER